MTKAIESPAATRYGRRQFLGLAGATTAGAALATTAGWLPGWVPGLKPEPAQAATFDLDHGNAPIELVIPTILPVLFSFVSPGANDATLVLRITTLVTNSWFDAIAPYDANGSAVGVYSNLGHRPASERTLRNKNIATLYASLRILESLLPLHAGTWRGMVLGVGLDPDDQQQDATSAVGIGNLAGAGIVAARENDGMNQLGDEGGVAYNLLPYADYLGYQPVNTAYELPHPGRWQPNVVTQGNGIFRVQQFVTPQLRVTAPYTKLGDLNAPKPVMSTPNHPGYKAQADQVLAASASLTDYQKMAAELFDHKIRGLGFSALFISQSRGFSLDEFVRYDFLTNLAAFDTAIAIWKQKHRWDAVRPFSAIRFLYGDGPVTAWGGVGKGTVNDLPASQWRSYLNTADHPEYPSASAALCSAHAESSRLFLGSDDFGWEVPAPAGSSLVEPGITPSSDIVLGPWATWTDFEQECGLSRNWGGVHFLSSIPAGQQIGRKVGGLANEFIQEHLAGES